MDIILPLLLQVVLIGLNAIFACAEIAVISMNEAKLNKLISEGNKNAKTLQKLTQNPSKFLSTIQIAITLSGFLGSAFAADNFAGMLVNWLTKLGIVNTSNASMFNTIAVVAITLILSYFTLVFGELIPKRVGMRKSEGIALALATPLYFISKMFTPIIWLLTKSINGVLRLIGIDPNQSDGDEGEEEIRLMVDMSSEKGLIDKEEREMIRNVFEFDDLTVVDFSTHRTDMEVLWFDDGVEKWDEIIKKSFHKHYPICKENTDDIIGILNIKEYFKLTKKDKTTIMKQAVQHPYFVPETIRADLLFAKMKQSRVQFAVVLDEYGGVEGVVTMNDIIEQIVGDFNNEDEQENTFIKKIDENKWKLSGTVTIKELNETINTTFPEDEYETVGGLVFGHYGSVPKDNTKFSIKIKNIEVFVESIKEHIIKEMIIQVIEEKQEEIVEST